MPEPITRQETYLNAIAQNTGGGSAGSVPEPITREEQFLDQIVTNTAGGGGGGGSSLPEVTSEDNGDVLTVVEGAWAKAAPSGGGGVLLIEVDCTSDVETGDLTYGTLTASDMEAIADALDNGVHPVIRLNIAAYENGVPLNFTQVKDDSFIETEYEKVDDEYVLRDYYFNSFVVLPDGTIDG